MTRSNPRTRPAGCTLVALALLVFSMAPASAQIPDDFTNLKLLPRDIGKQQLIGVMRDWAGGLGVRCNHCHVGPDNLQGMDFASDEKETKRAARVMLDMSRAINRDYVGSWEESGDEKRQVVSCFTCHRGQPEPPRKITSVLGETVQSDGVDAAMARYRELKNEYEGAGLYDLRPGIFGELAQSVFEMGKPEAGLQVLRAALEIYPESADLHAFLGMGLMHTGDAEAAASKFDEALALDPENGAARQGKMMLERMRSQDGQQP